MKSNFPSVEYVCGAEARDEPSEYIEYVVEEEKRNEEIDKEIIEVKRKREMKTVSGKRDGRASTSEGERKRVCECVREREREEEDNGNRQGTVSEGEQIEKSL